MSKTPSGGEASTNIGGRILADVKRRIIEGEFQPGERLPSRLSLTKTYRTTPVTMQRVMDHLVDDGFIRTVGRTGTFVSARPPHLTAYALVFPYRDQPRLPWPLYWKLLHSEASVVAAERNLELTVSLGNETHEDVGAYNTLVDNVRSKRFAGLIFASRPMYLQGSPLLEEPGIPRVALMARPESPNVHAVTLQGPLFPLLASKLRKTGHRRLGLVVSPELEALAEAFATAGGHGCEFRHHWLVLSPYGFPGVARRAVELLMRLPPSDRPDALLVGDDNLCDATIEAVLGAGLRVPEDVAIASHTNFPRKVEDTAPVLRAGYDVRAVLATCIDLLNRQRAGESLPPSTEIPIYDERALDASATAV
jgi:DNA-binding LacI/PurR family transcriptional regulator